MTSLDKALQLEIQRFGQVLKVDIEEKLGEINKGKDEGQAPVKISDLYAEYEESLAAMDDKDVAKILVEGKATREAIRKRIREKTGWDGSIRVTAVKLSGVPVNFSLGDCLDPTDISFARFCSMVALYQFLNKKPEDIPEPSLAAGLMLPNNSIVKKFVPLMVPGYGFLYRALFVDGMTDKRGKVVVMGELDKPAYIAGAFMLDWLSECSKLSPAAAAQYTLKDFYVNRDWIKSQGNIVAIMRNSSGIDEADPKHPFNLNEAQKKAMKGCLSVSMTKRMKGAGMQERMKRVATNWAM